MHRRFKSSEIFMQLPVKSVIAFVLFGVVTVSTSTPLLAEEPGCDSKSGEVGCAPCKTTPFEVSFPVDGVLDEDSAICEGTSQGPTTPPVPPAPPDPVNNPPGGWICRSSSCVVVYDIRGRETNRTPPNCTTPENCFKRNPSRRNGRNTGGVPAGGPLSEIWTEYMRQVQANMEAICQCNPAVCTNPISCKFDESRSSFWLDSFTTAKDADGDCVMNGVVRGLAACKGRCNPRVVGH